MRPRSTASLLALIAATVAWSSVSDSALGATVAHFTFNETGNAPGNSGTNATPVKMRNDAGTTADFHSADAGGVSGLPGDRSFANTGPNVMGSLASAATRSTR